MSTAADLVVGAEFHNHKELIDAIETFQRKNFVQLYVRSSRSVESAKRRTPKRNFPADFKHTELDYACIHGGRKHTATSTGQRPKQQTFLKECPFRIQVRTNTAGTALFVKNMEVTHNHEVHEAGFAHLPQQRRLASPERKKVKELLTMKANKKLVQEELMADTGKIITLKDLHNIDGINRQKGDLAALLDEMNKIDNATVELVVDSSNTLKSIYFQKEEWKTTYQRYPEILFVDATYKLNNLHMPLYVLLVEDGNGESEVVCLWFVCCEDRDTLSKLLQIFKSVNVTSKTVCIMTDKDMVERDVFSQGLPDAKLLLCLFHVLRSMKREVTTEKMGITSAQRLSVLNILQLIAHARSEADYSEKYNLLQQTKLKSVVDYYDKNWHDIRSEWVDGLRNDVTHFANKTNNRLEAINQKIKSVVTKFSNLSVCFSELMSWLSSLSIECDHRAISCVQKVPVMIEDPDLQPYQELVTPYAFAFVKKQYTLISSVTPIHVDTENKQCRFHSSTHQINTTVHTCSCGTLQSIQLPCRHIFALRLSLGLPFFLAELVAQRWTIDYYKKSQRVFLVCDNFGPASISITQQQSRPPRVLSQHEKFRQASKLTQQLAVLASETPSREFPHALKCLSDILHAWQNGQHVKVHVVNDVEEGSYQSGSHEAVVESVQSGSHEAVVESVQSGSDEAVVESVQSGSDEAVVESVQSGSDEAVVESVQSGSDGAVVESDASDQEVIQVLYELATQAAGEECDTPLQSDTVSNRELINEINMPNRRKVRGRPKGAGLTAIGLPKKCQKINRPVPFSKLSEDSKELKMLSWVLPYQSFEKCQRGEVLDCSDLPRNVLEIKLNVLDDNVNWPVIQKYFTKKSWLALSRMKIELERKGVWICYVCSGDLSLLESIVCEACLNWFHLPCAALASKPKSKLWFCRTCHSGY